LKVHKSKPPPSLEDQTSAPITEAPVTEAPITEAPATEAPITEAPATEAPITEAPATEAPITEAPATEAPVTEAPITEAPATEAPVTESPVVTEAPGSVSLNAEGFKATTSLCCPEKMEAFFNSLLDSLGYDVCSKPHVQGLMHWFTCVPDMDFQYMLDVIQNGNPCKYWAPKGQTCPTLSEQCAGHGCR